MAYQSWSVVFGEQPSAAKWNILGTNDARFESWITTDTRAYVGTFGSTVFDSTGNKSATGLGFLPKLVRFTIRKNSGADMWTGSGAMDSAGNQFYTTSTHDASANAGGTASGTDGCIAITGLATDTLDMKAIFVSMDADGFTVNCNNAASIGAVLVSYEAYG